MSAATASDIGGVVANRFVLVEEAGSGGMGTVYRARDLQTGLVVAVKVLRQVHESDRFLLEAQTLSELRHPGIVSYIAHGKVSASDPRLYLAMEWLDGCDLSSLLRERGLSLHESLSLIHGAADALASAHRRGIVHRDIKPSNLFLRGGDVARVTLLDFGIAHRGVDRTGMTRTGQVLGTPQYMSPEQAQGLRHIGPAADVFSLGCVLFECLTGDPPFSGDQFAAVVSKLLFGSRPLLRQVRPDVPDSVEPLERLVYQMLARAPEERPTDGAALYAAIEQLFGLPECDPPSRRKVAPATMSGDQQLLSVIVSTPHAISEVDEPTISGMPSDLQAPDTDPSTQTQGSLLALLSALTAEVSVQRNGMLVLTLAHPHLSSATDLAVQAARCAAMLREHCPTACFAISTGTGSMNQHAPEGPAVEQATEHIRQILLRSPRPVGQVVLDELTMNLIRGHFAVERCAGTGDPLFCLQGEVRTVDEQPDDDSPPPLCIGRDSELAMLDGVFVACRDDSVARGALVIGPAGIGKTRLRRELLRRLSARDETYAVMLGAGDPLSLGASYGLLGQAIRQCSGLSDRPHNRKAGEVDERRDQLRSWLGGFVPNADLDRLTLYIGEICGIALPEGGGGEPGRQGAHDPRELAQHVSDAWFDLLRHLCQRQPLIVVLEDLQWGDQLTVRLIDTALRELRDCPLMVLALGRPEVRDAFPALWSGRDVLELRLGGLSRRASERLLDQLVARRGGARLPAAQREQMLAYAAGNALFLEELAHCEQEGHAQDPATGQPQTVLAMLQARLNRVDSGARRILRTASVFGDRFWRGGLAHVLGKNVPAVTLSRWLKLLVEAEFIDRQRESRYPSDEEYSFRQPLLRHAVYALLFDDERVSLHQLVLQYLLNVGERDPATLQHHRTAASGP